jgi:hypothetical protein
MAHEHHENSLPAELNAPLLLGTWRRKAMIVGAIFAVLSIVLAFLAATVDHDGCVLICSATPFAGALPLVAWRC